MGCRVGQRHYGLQNTPLDTRGCFGLTNQMVLSLLSSSDSLGTLRALTTRMTTQEVQTMRRCGKRCLSVKCTHANRSDSLRRPRGESNMISSLFRCKMLIHQGCQQRTSEFDDKASESRTDQTRKSPETTWSKLRLNFHGSLTETCGL